MKKDMTELPLDVQAQMRTPESLPDDQIDTTDAPEILDWSDARRGVFYRPVKQQITLRLDRGNHRLGSRLTPQMAADTRRTSMARSATTCAG